MKVYRLIDRRTLLWIKEYKTLDEAIKQCDHLNKCAGEVFYKIKEYDNNISKYTPDL